MRKGVKGTHVLSADKEWVLIENMKIGDFLWSHSVQTGAKVSKEFFQKLPKHRKTLPLCIKHDDPRF